MDKLAGVGRFFLAVATLAFGAQHFVYLDFVTRLFPKLPAWVPAHAFLSGVLGAFLLASGAAIMIEKSARSAALLLGAVILSSFVLLYMPLLITNPPNGGLWTRAGKALAFSGGSFLVAGSLPMKLDGPASAPARALRASARFIPLGHFFLAAFLILCGIEHFIYAEFVTSLVPSWVPGGAFWTYFTGVALIAGGLGIIVPPTSRLAGALSGLMIFMWVFLVHIPRALADLSDSNETTAVFEALAFSGVAFLVAAKPKGNLIHEATPRDTKAHQEWISSS
ncbi:MAG TPA: hypothetical protein VFS27_12950 [Blastocatellia bacterium]|jgi:uncharacterized membrane protein|nr:hypothetical protein [Blastocatellia bacterium]